MKTKVFLRLTKDGRVRATQKYDPEPIRDTYKRALPTVYCAIDLEIPDTAFNPPNIFASIKVPIEKIGSSIEVVDPLKLL